jgi:SAM-dependent methyltransferase
MYDDIVDIYSEIFPLNQAFIAFIATYVKKPHAKILDLGCGTGDYVDELTRLNYDVTGIDNSPAMIEHAKKNNQGTFVHCSFAEISKIEGKFDYVYCVGNSLSYVSDNLINLFLNNVCQLLQVGGYLLLQIVNWDKFRQTGASAFPVKSLADGSRFHRKYEAKDNATVIFHTELRKDGTVVDSWSDTLYPKYSDSVAKNLAAAAMTITGLYGSYKKSPFDPETSPALIVAAQKK